MSLILDAIKKSEKERQQQQVPTINESHSEYLEPEQQNNGWMKWIAILGIIALLFLGYWGYGYVLKPSKNTIGNNPTLNKQPEIEKAKSDTLVLSPKKQLEDSSKGGGSVSSPKKSQPKITSTTKKVSQPQKSLRTQPHKTQTIIDKSVAMTSDPQTESETIKIHSENIPEIESLPLSFKRKIPDFSYTSHVYTGDMATSFVVLNKEIYAVGDKLTDSIVIDGIQSDSLILNFRGTRFKLKQLQSWKSP